MVPRPRPPRHASEHPAERAKSARVKAQAEARRRKEEFIGARVPLDLREKIFRRAEAEGIPASLLIRRILEEAFRAEAEAAPSRAQNPMPDQVSLAQPKTGARFPDVLGWESITLHKPTTCASCAVALPAGSAAALGFSASGGAPVVLCGRCRAAV